ncbi:MAG: tryptophan--tRNA ligase [Phenylobacterium sp.]|jgi:tryptophanyl-tRNA synthetase|uniref:tryptophan--tRNA ligase n=1 Tax=Phenylobacterium sp. TaxID=1871053 RepID=UPI001B79A1D3|nr:tryptophan--tRNA ligase [Phenylobacterium sp.]MBP7649795.1 tryptophan--tRNA ligase [Phenylobacterium sp.]MBP7816415.1 tryptophan--tRNA ligase [Phenylobacterium sp.]
MTEQAAAAYAGQRRVLSGVQPSGALHLGNYLGALVKFTRLQNEMETFIFVADMHAITVWQDPKLLTSQVREIAAAYLASGLDPAKATIFPQSAVPEHAQLAWIFNCVARLGWLDRMTQFKDKAGKHKERESVGLYTYPVLQAADILIYKATHVPVGEDQRQHLELTRDIAAKFNHDFDAPGFFPLPEALTEGPGARIMSLRDGSAKMSKSDPSDNSRLNLMDDADTISQKIRKARTDPDPLPETLEELKDRPEALNLIGIYAALAERTAADVLAEFTGQGFGQSFKPMLADLAVAKFGAISGEMRRLMSQPDEIDAILAAGAEKAREAAAPTLAEVKKIVGFWGA